jgi:hypothetical protein
MGRVLPFLAFLVLLSCALPAAAGEEFPRVVFPDGHVLSADPNGMVTVENSLVQIELSRGKIASAQRGTQFAISNSEPSAGVVQLRVQRGTIILVDVQSNTLAQIPPGSYRIHPEGIEAVGPFTVRGGAEADDAEVSTPSYRLSDAVMTQQQKYLDSLKVDIRDINKALASIIRSLVPRHR